MKRLLKQYVIAAACALTLTFTYTTLATERGTRDEDQKHPHQYRATSNQIWRSFREHYNSISSLMYWGMYFPGYYLATKDKPTVSDDQFKQHLGNGQVTLIAFKSIEDVLREKK